MNIAVVGGGASGMMAAIAAAGKGARVFLYEQKERVGKKILATGNGKCNFSNRQLSASCYYGEDTEKIKKVLARFDTDCAVSFFEEAGMCIKDKNGYLYPLSEQASTVLDILRLQLLKYRVTVLTEEKVTGLTVEEKRNGIYVHTKNKRIFYDKVILACGGKAAPKTGSDGNGYLLAKSKGHSLISRCLHWCSLFVWKI